MWPKNLQQLKMRSRGKILQAAWNLRLTSSKVSSNENALPLDIFLSHNQPQKTYFRERLYSSEENYQDEISEKRNNVNWFCQYSEKYLLFSSYECLLRSVQPAMISVRCFITRSQSEVLFDAPSFKLAACRVRKELNQCEVQTTRPELFEQR